MMSPIAILAALSVAAAPTGTTTAADRKQKSEIAAAVVAVTDTVSLIAYCITRADSTAKVRRCWEIGEETLARTAPGDTPFDNMIFVMSAGARDTLTWARDRKLKVLACDVDGRSADVCEQKFPLYGAGRVSR